MGEVVKVKQLGLAAFMKMKGATLLSVEDKQFMFETDHAESEWRLLYSNSCCNKHDSIVCDLRQFLK